MPIPPHPANRRRSGVAAVELAICLPILAFFLVITIDFSRVFYYSITVTNCARSGATYGSQKPANALDTSGIQAFATMDASNLNATSLKVTSSVNNTTNPTKLKVTATYPFATITNFPGIAGTTVLTRTVEVNVAPLVPN